MSTPITKYVKDATVLMLAKSGTGFNASLTGLAAAYGIQPFSIDWTPGGPQFFKLWGTPDDLEESAVSKYPMAFLYGVRSQNTHESLGRNFSGPVTVELAFWLTHKSSSFSKAGSYLEVACDAVEDVCNGLFKNGNWPQGFGASSTVCAPPVCQRGPVDPFGESWRQSITFTLVFTMDTN